MPRASPLRPDPSTPRWCRKGRPFRGGSARRLSKRGGVSGSPQGPSSAPTKGLRSQPRRAVCTPSWVKSGMTDDSNLFGLSTFFSKKQIDSSVYSYRRLPSMRTWKERHYLCNVLTLTIKGSWCETFVNLPWRPWRSIILAWISTPLGQSQLSFSY